MSIFGKMDKIEYQAVTKSFTTVTFWATCLNQGSRDDECLGRPEPATTDDKIAKVHRKKKNSVLEATLFDV